MVRIEPAILGDDQSEGLSSLTVRTVIIYDAVELDRRGLGEVPPFGGHALVVDVEEDPGAIR